MVSVCIATFNGGKYIEQQISSILPQLKKDDQVIISDDSSTDNTLEIIESFNDSRITVIPGQKFHSPIFNFENALKNATGDYIFLCDQDDVWEDNKVDVMLHYLSKYCMVISNCSIIDGNGKQIRESYYSTVPHGCLVRNLIHNHYLGCCMAFRRELLDIALPFPSKIAMHDIWLGLCAAMKNSVLFIPDKLIKYRRHGNNASPTSESSKLPIMYRIEYRLYFIVQLIKRFKIKHL